MDFDAKRLTGATMPASARLLLLILVAIVASTSGFAEEAESANQVQETTDEVSTSQASTTTTSSLVLDTTDISNSSSKYSSSVNLTTVTDSKNTSDETKSYDGTLGLGIGYRINETYKAGFSASIRKNLSNSYEESLANSSVSLGHRAIKLNNNLSASPKMVVTFPTNRKSREIDYLNGALTLATSFASEVYPKLSLTFTPLVTAYFNEYTTNRNNEVNQQYSASESLSLGYSISDKFSVSAGVSFTQSWSYLGTKRDDQYGTDLSTNYLLDKKSSLTAGISTGGQIYRSQRGPDSAIEIYDPASTSFYLTYGISL